MSPYSTCLNPKDVFYAKPEEGTCPGCGCVLSSYEVFACRLRGLKRPVCIGCMAGALVFVRDGLLPLVDRLEKAVAELAEKVPAGR